MSNTNMTELEIKLLALRHLYKKGFIDRKDYRDITLKLIGVAINE